MRNEEPTGTEPPPGFSGDLAADVGVSLGLWARPEPARGPLPGTPRQGACLSDRRRVHECRSRAVEPGRSRPRRAPLPLGHPC
jgi:hypothetical protein